MRLTRSLGFAGALIAAALVGGTLIGSAFATDEATDTDPASSSTRYCDVFMDALAADLGISREALVSAGRSAANATLDAAVEAGDIATDRADAFRDRIAEMDGAGCGLLGGGKGLAFGRGFDLGLERGMARGLGGAHVFSAAADALGLESSALIDELRDAGSLEAVAQERAVSYDDVKSAVLASVQSRLNAVVANGLSQDRADTMLERISTWLDAGGELSARGMGLGRGHGIGQGPWGGRDRGGWNGGDTTESGN
jgi:hypothetical protein